MNKTNLFKTTLSLADKIKISLHNHSFYSPDSKEDPKEIVEEAIRQNLDAIGISDHCPLPFPYPYNGMKEDDVNDYLNSLGRLKKRFKKQIEVLIGMEIDYLHFDPGLTLPLLNLPLDFTIGVVHLIKRKNRIFRIDFSEEEFEKIVREVFNDHVEKFCEFYYRVVIDLLKLKKFDILGHLDLIKKFNKDEKYFSEKETWYQKLIDEVLQEIVKSNIIVEVNTAGLDRPVKETYPSVWVIKKLIQRKIPFVLSSDAHEASLITRHFPETGEMISQLET